MLEDIVSVFIESNVLLTKDGLHLVALSGGADSVALLCIMQKLGYKIEAIHCNFNLRGEESNRDEEFCKSLCKEKGVELHLVHFDTRFYANTKHISIEMAARELRYNYFHQLRNELNAESICVAHHTDDNAETVLMNIVRGTGITGLTGIKPKNGCIVRPLLAVSRKDIEDYLMLCGQEYITDSSNLVNDVKRNKIRLDIMPLLKELNPSVVNSITSTAKHVADAMPLLNESLERWEKELVQNVQTNNDVFNGYTDDSDGFQPVAINIKKLRGCPSPEYMLYHILSKYGFPPQLSTQVFDNLDAQTGKTWQIANRNLTIDRGHLLIEPLYSAFCELTIPMEGKYVLCNGDRIEVSFHDKNAGFTVDTSANVAQLDAEIVRMPLKIRTVRNGDRFVPFGMKGSKLVSDLLTDRKMSLQQKRHQLCVTDDSGQIVWLMGLRISNNYRITSHTIKYVSIRYIKNRN